jgi:hypothetical protein
MKRIFPIRKQFSLGMQASEAASRRQWLRDPLSHPQLEKMSATQLADLPFEPRRVRGE